MRAYLREWHDGESPAAALNSRRSHDEVLRQSAFSRLATLAYPVARHWSFNDIVGYVYSTSSGNPALFGDRIDAFEAGLGG